MWDALAAWFQSPAGQRVMLSAVVPAIAILVAAALAALIARSAVRGLLRRFDQDAAASAVAALLDAATVSAAWAEADRHERRRAQRLQTEADVRVRLLPRPGAALAADWAGLRIESLRGGSEVGPSVQTQLEELRERLLAWLVRPRRAKRLFGDEVERLSAERSGRRAAVAAPAEKPSVQARPVPGTAEETTPAPAAAVAADPAPAAEAEAEAEAVDEPKPAAAAEPDPEPQAGPEPAAEPTEPEITRLPSTEPVAVQRPRHGEAPEPVLALGGAARAEKARHARQGEEGPAAPDPLPAPAAAATPAWLDEYDDDADVTQQSMNLKTPPPVAATSVHDRRHTGDNILPRD